MSNKKFPCKDCLVKITCSKECNKIEQNTDEISLHFIYLEYFIKFICPDCGHNNGDIPANADVITIRCQSCNHIFSVYMSCKYLVDYVKREVLL